MSFDIFPCPSWTCQKSDEAKGARCTHWAVKKWPCFAFRMRLRAAGRCLASPKVVWPSEHLSRAYNGLSSNISAHLCEPINVAMWDLIEVEQKTNKTRKNIKDTYCATNQKTMKDGLWVFVTTLDPEQNEDRLGAWVPAWLLKYLSKADGEPYSMRRASSVWWNCNPA